MNYKHYFISLFLGGALFAQDANISDSQKPSNKEDSSEKETPNEIKSSQENLPSETHFITASRNKRAPETLAANVTIIGPEKIAQSNARNVAELVKNEAGVMVKKSFNDADKFNIDIRGFGEVSAQNTLVLIDGRKVNKPDLSGYDLTTIPLNRIERIEIYRGGRSVLYGDNATGGVINIITKRTPSTDDTKKRHKLTLNSEVGSWEYYKLGANLEGFAEDLYYNLDSSYSDSNGYHDESGYNTKTVGFSVLSTEFENLELFIAGGASESNVQHSGPRKDKRNSGTNNRRYTETEEQYLTLTPKYWITDDVSLEVQTSIREAKRNPDDNGFAPFDEFETNDLSISPKMTIHEDFKSFENTFVIGLDHRYSEMLDYQYGASDEIIKRDTGAYFYNSSAFLDNSLYFDFGYRREQSRINLNNGTSDRNDLDAFSAGLTYVYKDKSKVFVSYDRSFRTQKVDELGGPGFDELLDPQTSKTWQAGIKHQFTDRLSADFTVFHIDIQNEIFYDPTVPGAFPGFDGQNTSYDETERQGFELGSQYQALDTLTLYTNFTYMDAELKGDDQTVGTDGNTIPGVAEQFANFGFSWDFIESWNLNMNAHWKDNMYVHSDFTNTADKQESYITVDARVTYTWEWLSVYGGVNNLFDEEYNEFTATYGEYTAPDRNFVTGFVITHEF